MQAAKILFSLLFSQTYKPLEHVISVVTKAEVKRPLKKDFQKGDIAERYYSR